MSKHDFMTEDSGHYFQEGTSLLVYDSIEVSSDFGSLLRNMGQQSSEVAGRLILGASIDTAVHCDAGRHL